MTAYDKDSVLLEDTARSAALCPDAEKLSDSTVMITGATGLIGAQLVRTLMLLNRERNAGIRILALVRSAEKAARVLGEERDGLELIIGDVLDMPPVDGEVDYIIHGASVTSSKAFVDTPVETIRTALTGTENLLRLAVEKNVRSFVYLSSLEVYGVTDPSLDYVTESDYGYIDPLSVRSSYSEGKRMAENLCAAYAHQYGVPVRIARLAQTFGAGIEYGDGRVFAMLVRSVIEKKDIVLRTKGDTLRNYCYISDAVTGLLTVMLRGEDGRAYNIANRDTGVSILDMAEMMCRNYPEAEIKVVFDIAEDVTKLGFNPTVVIRLDPTETERLGWHAEVGLDEMFDRTVRSLRERYGV